MNEMTADNNADAKVKTGEYHAPWEKSFDRILTPFEEFIHRQTTSGLLLMGTAVLANGAAGRKLPTCATHLYQHRDWRLGGKNDFAPLDQ